MDQEDFDMVMDAARRWFAEHQPLAERIAHFHDGHRPAPETWNAVQEMGWAALTTSEEGGGFNATPAQCFEFLRLAGRDARPEPLDLVLMLGNMDLPWNGQRPQRLALAQLGDGSADSSVRCDADAAPDAQHTATGQSRVLHGGAWATHALVPETMTEGRVRFLAVPLDAPGVTREAVRLIDGRHTFRLMLQRAPVSVLGDGRQAEVIARRVLDRAAAGLVADATGVLEAAFELTLDYLKQRHQFGVPLSSQQTLQQRMADIFCDLQLLLALTRRMAGEMAADADGPWSTLPVAKAFIGRRALRAAGQLIHLSGGIGMSEEYRLGHLYKRLHVDATLFGDAETNLSRIDLHHILIA